MNSINAAENQQPQEDNLQEDPASRMVWLQGRLAIIDEIAEKRWLRLNNYLVREEAKADDVRDYFFVQKQLILTDQERKRAKQKRDSRRRSYDPDLTI